MDQIVLVRLLLTGTIALLTALMVAKVSSPWARPRPGNREQETRVRYRQRLLLYRFHVLGILAIVLLGRIVPGGPWVPEGADFLAVLLILGWLFVPVVYYFTDCGFAIGAGRFYEWSEFGDYRRGLNVIQLRATGRRGGVSLFLNNSQQQSVLPVLRRYISQRAAGA